MSIRNLIFGVNSVTILYLICYDSLLQNAVDVITKCDSYFITNATEVYYKMRQVFYYKVRHFYYKMRQLLQNATILLQNATFITKCDVYYKLRQYKVLFAIIQQLLFINTKRDSV